MIRAQRMLVAIAIAVFACVSVMAESTLATPIPTGDFSIEVSPSPLVATVQPGVPQTLELRIRNASLHAEELKIEARSFRLTDDSTSITLGTSTPSDLAEWIGFKKPVFSVGPGEWFEQSITITLPEQAGFSYPFAVVISRAKETATDPTSGRLLQGSVAVFTLVNVDKPGATRKLELESLTTSQPVYEYLPATIQLQLKNTGNSIVQPYGNFYIQNESNAAKPLAVLAVNDENSYILPGKSRQVTAQWVDGFPVYKKTGDKYYTDWSSHKLGDFRLGLYTAKVVAVYNDGTRDVPITGEVSFWVLPWKIILGALLICAILFVGVWTIVRRSIAKLRTVQLRKDS